MKAVRGLDCDPVRRYGDKPAPKSIGRSVTLPEDVTDALRVRGIFAELADDISSKLRREGMLAGAVQVQIKDNTFKTSQYQKKLSNPTRIADELLSAAIGLVRSNNALRVPARLVGMTACDLVGEDEGFQLSFDFDQTHADSMEQLGSRVDGLRDKYGKQIIRRASQLNSEQKESKDPVNDNDSYYFIYDGKKFNAGDKISSIEEKTDLVVREREKTEDVPANKYMIGAGYIQTADKKTSFYVTPYNTESSAVKVPDTSIGGFDLDEDNLKYDSKLADVEVVGGLKLGSSLDDVKKVFGETEEIYEGTNYDQYTYKSKEVYRNYEFKFSKDEKKVIEIKWKNLVFDK